MSDIARAMFGGVFAVVYSCIHSEKKATYTPSIVAATSLSASDVEHIAEALIREGLVCQQHLGYCRVPIPQDVHQYVLEGH